MQATVELNGCAVGTLEWESDAFGAQVQLDCAVPDDASALLRCYGETAGKPLLIGLPEPIDGRLRLTRRLSRETLKEAGCAHRPPVRFYLADAAAPQHTAAPAFAPPPEPAPEPEPVPEPPDAAVRTGDAVLDALLGSADVVAERHTDAIVARCAFAADRPFALAPAFVLCAVENGEAMLRCKNEGAAF